jgi:hypothetical protein
MIMIIINRTIARCSAETEYLNNDN